MTDDPGTTADAATEADVVATLDEWVACATRQDRLRLYALLSDDGLRWVLAHEGELEAVDPVAAWLATPPSTPPQPLPVAEFDAVVVRDIRLLSDGRAVAVLARDAGPPDRTTSELWVFSRQGDRWVIDLMLGPLVDGHRY